LTIAVLKTSGSAFENFLRDEYTTLAEVSDRLFSTSVTLSYTIPLPPNIPLSIENLGQIAKEIDFAKVATSVKKDTLEVFAEDESASVQVRIIHRVYAWLIRLGDHVQYSSKGSSLVPFNLGDIIQLSQQALHVSQSALLIRRCLTQHIVPSISVHSAWRMG
jgi:urate oxidase